MDSKDMARRLRTGLKCLKIKASLGIL